MKRLDVQKLTNEYSIWINSLNSNCIRNSVTDPAHYHEEVQRWCGTSKSIFKILQFRIK